MTKGRQLNSEEKNLWKQVTKNTIPLHKVQENSPKEAANKETKTAPMPKFVLSPFQVGQKQSVKTTVSSFQTLHGEKNDNLVRMEQKAYMRMKKGKLGPEARLDLHGMTLDQAHPALIQFILSSYEKGHRLVLIITGKGDRYDPYNSAPLRRGILRRQVPLWLKQQPVASVILQTSEAHYKHGGKGAYYIYLVRRR